MINENGRSLPSATTTFGMLKKTLALAPAQTRGIALAPVNSAVPFHMLTKVPCTPAPAPAFAPNLACAIASANSEVFDPGHDDFDDGPSSPPASFTDFPPAPAKAPASAHAPTTGHVPVPCNFASCSTDPGTITVSAAASAPAPALQATAAQSLASYVFKTTTQAFETSHAEDFRWMEVSSAEHCDGKVVMDSFFLKGLSVNPEFVFEKDACTPYQWSHVVLLALYYGDDIEGTTNKSIWHSVNNSTPFAIVWPSVRGRIEKCIDALQLRATKSTPLEGYGRRNGIVPVQNVKVKFSVIKHATMETLLNMTDKVR